MKIPPSCFLTRVRSVFAALLGLGLLGSSAHAVGPKIEMPRRSISATGQFVIYCDDLQMRMAVGSFAEDTKRGLLALLGIKDEWRFPLVITIVPERAALPGQPLSEVRLLETEAGYREELNVVLGERLADAHFQQQLVRAFLLEVAYRDRPVTTVTQDVPTWLTEGVTRYLQTRETHDDADLFKALVNVSKLPPLRAFLTERPRPTEGIPLTLYRAYALSLVEILSELPNGSARLAQFVRHIPGASGDPVADLRQFFPALGETDVTMEKWWALSMARLSASDRYRGLTLSETVQRLTPLLEVKIPVPVETPKARKPKKGEPVAAAAVPLSATPPMKTFPLASFPEYLKISGSRDVLKQQANQLLDLETRANPLLKPAVAQYRLSVAQLAEGHTKGVAARIKDGDDYRQLVLERLDAIADYLNWFEATQIRTRSTAFDTYLREAKELAEPVAAPPTAITRYLDVLEQQLR